MNQHNREIYGGGLGLREEELERLKDETVILAAPRLASLGAGGAPRPLP